MIDTLLAHGWKRLSRSASFEKEIATTIMLGILALMMLGYTMALGFFLDKLITKVLGQTDSFAFLNQFILYYFILEFIMRYLIQNVPVLDVQPYLHLPIKRSKLIHYLLGKSVLHLFNVLTPLLFTPFAFSAIAPRLGESAAWGWLGSLVFISLIIHYLIMVFKKRLDDTAWGMLALIGFFGALGAADYFQWFQLTTVSGLVFKAVAHQPAISLLFAFAVMIMYSINFRVFMRGLYADEWIAQKTTTATWGKQNFGFLQSFGLLGDWISLELKLILRHKRTRSILFMSGLFLLYGFIFYRKDGIGESPGLILFGGIIITGVFMLNYGQFLFSWQASHFDFTFTRPLSLKQYLESKYWLLVSVSIICFLISIPYVLFGWEILLVQFVALLFNLGVNIYVMMNIAMWGPKRLNLSKGGTLNYEGVGAAQWLMGVPVLLGPYVFYLPFHLAGYPYAGLMAVGIAGLIGIALRPYLLTLTANRFAARKYKIGEGFRHE